MRSAGFGYFGDNRSLEMVMSRMTVLSDNNGYDFSGFGRNAQDDQPLVGPPAPHLLAMRLPGHARSH
jgi:hypothetical protein